MQTKDAAENNQAGQWFTAVGEVAGQIGSTSNYFFVPQSVLDGPEEDRALGALFGKLPTTLAVKNRER